MAEESDTDPRRRRAGTPPHAEVDAIERALRDHAGSPERPDTAGVAAVRENASVVTPFPQRITRKYYVTQPLQSAEERRVYADERGKYLVFKDEGHRLTTQRQDAAIVRDLVAVAVHRDWTALRVSGSTAFRREVWLEASARGLDVSGYAPSPLDLAAVARRDDAQQRKDSPRNLGRSSVSTRPSERDIASALAGRGPEEGSAFGTGSHVLREAIPVSETDQSHTAAPSHDRARTTSKRDRLDSPPPADARKDATLAAAHSHIAVLDRALHRAFPENAAVREVVLRAARERVAFHLDQGRALRRAVYRVPLPENSQQFRAPAGRDRSPMTGVLRREQRDRER